MENRELIELVNDDEKGDFPSSNLPAVLRDKSKNPAYVYLASLSPGSQKNMRAILGRIAKFFGYPNIDVCPWEFLNAQAFVAVKNFLLSKNASPATVNLYLSALRGVVRSAWRMELITDHQRAVIEDIPGARGSRVLKGRALTALESHALLDLCIRENTAIGIRDAAIIGMGIGFGLRRAEIAGVLTKNIDFSSQIVSVIGKGNKEREVTGSDIVWQRIQCWKDIRGEEGSERFFCRIDKHGNLLKDQPIKSEGVFFMLQKRAKQAGIESFTPHDLRRTFATRMLEIGADIAIVKEAMGHSSVQTTMRYDKRGIEKIRQFSRAVYI